MTKLLFTLLSIIALLYAYANPTERKPALIVSGIWALCAIALFAW